jgi:hypothetical protein
VEKDGVTRQNPPFGAGRSANNKRRKPDTSQPANAANGTHKRGFEQKVAKVTKGIRVELGGGWRHPAKSPVSRWTFSEQQEVQAGHSQPANAPTEHTKREFEQKVAKGTKGIRVELGGGWRHAAKSSGMTKALAVTSANPVPQSPSFPLPPSVQNLLAVSGFRSSTATASICAVCGNMSKGWMATIS